MSQLGEGQQFVEQMEDGTLTLLLLCAQVRYIVWHYKYED